METGLRGCAGAWSPAVSPSCGCAAGARPGGDAEKRAVFQSRSTAGFCLSKSRCAERKFPRPDPQYGESAAVNFSPGRLGHAVSCRVWREPRSCWRRGGCCLGRGAAGLRRGESLCPVIYGWPAAPFCAEQRDGLEHVCTAAARRRRVPCRPKGFSHGHSESSSPRRQLGQGKDSSVDLALSTLGVRPT